MTGVLVVIGALLGCLIGTRALRPRAAVAPADRPSSRRRTH